MRFLAAGLVMWMAQSVAQMGLPVQGITRADLHDTFNEVHNGHAHEAIDIMAPRGTPVHAAVSGTVRRLFLSKPGGNTIYEFDEAGELCYYYAHLDRYADGVHEGMRVDTRRHHCLCGIDGQRGPSQATPAFRRVRARSEARVVERQADQPLSQSCDSPWRQQVGCDGPDNLGGTSPSGSSLPGVEAARTRARTAVADAQGI